MRLDRLDPYLTTFTGTVTAVQHDGARTLVALDRSAFYPTAGGQEHDTGTLAGLAVVDVTVVDGAVWHHLDRAPTGAAGDGPERLPGVGDVVTGVIDWDRRFSHMQRHTGQHLLSQAFVRVGAAHGADHGTRSVGLRSADCTLDLAGAPDPETCREAEEEANAVARRALPVSTFEVEERFLPEYRLRRPATVGGLVRLVAIGDYDVAACGGTHVRSSAELLPIAVLGSERVRGGLTRVTFRVGQEALEDAVLRRDVTAGLGTTLSARADELPARVERLQADLAAVRAELAVERAGVAARLVAEALAATGAAVPLSLVLDEVDARLYDAVVDAAQRTAGLVALVAVGEQGRARVTLTAGPGSGADVRPALKAAMDVLGGRGGGRPDRAAGAGPATERLGAAVAAALAVLAAGSDG